MLSKEEKKKQMEELESLYREALNSSPELINNIQELPDIANIEVYDYEKDIEESKAEGKEVIDNMADLYLGTSPEVLNHPYIKKKKYHDANNSADMLFLKKMAKRALIVQLKQMDIGDTSHRNFETFYAGIKEMRDIVKQSTSTQNLQETFYKQLKDDLGLQIAPIVNESSSGDNSGTITSQKNLNDILKKMIDKKNKESDDSL